MLGRINYLCEQGEDFAIETTLATKSYVSLIKKLKQKGYTVTLLFFWLNTVELAISRVDERVKKGGHNIPKDVIERRYIAGLKNLNKLYLSVVDNYYIFDNSEDILESIAENTSINGKKIIENNKFKIITTYGK